MLFRTLVALATVSASPLHAQGLLRDIHQGEGALHHANASGFAVFDGAIFSAVEREGLGRELHRLDPGVIGAGTLIDLVPGAGDSSPTDLTAVGDRMFFEARRVGTGRELHVTDGTAAGTYLVAESLPGAAAASRSEFTALGDNLVFLQSSMVYRSDGTEAGTYALTDQYTPELQRFGDHVYFSQPSESSDQALWRVVPDATGVEWVADVAPGAPASPLPLLGQFTVAADWMYFTGNDASGVQRLWRTDGTDGTGVELVSTAVSEPTSLVAVQSAVFFLGVNAAGEEGVWKSRGTAATTVEVVSVDGLEASPLTATTSGVFYTAKTALAGEELYFANGDGGAVLLELVPGAAGHKVKEPVGLGHRLVFVSKAGDASQRIWSTDGTPAGTVPLLGDPGGFPTKPAELTVAGGLVWFQADDPALGNELFATDGTPAGTGLVADVNPGPLNGSSGPDLFADVGGKLFFTANDGQHGREPWISDGTVQGTHLLHDAAPGHLGSDPSEVVAFDDRLVFAASSSSHGSSLLFVTDGTEAGTAPLAPPELTHAAELFATPERVYFSGQTAASGEELWTTDGTAEGTHLLAELEPGAGWSRPRNFRRLASGTVIFSATTTGVGGGLWTANGETVEFLIDVEPETANSVSSQLGVFGGELIFRAADPEAGREPWLTDGTLEGTRLLADVEPGSGGSDMEQPTAVGTALFFTARTSAAGRELWVSDGTAEGTQLVGDFLSGPESSYPALHAELDGRLLFSAIPEASPLSADTRSLWITDGTPEGTELLLDMSAAEDAPGVTGLVAVSGDVAYFVVDDDQGTDVLWKTDGTPAGTVLVADTDPLEVLPGQKVEELGPLGGDAKILFRGHAPETGGELWLSDGTGAGTALLADLDPGVVASSPEGFFRAGDTVFFTARTVEVGTELYAMPFAATGSWAVQPYGSGCAGSGGTVPELSSAGPAQTGAVLTLQLDAVEAGVLAALLWSPNRAALAWSGACKLYLGLPLFVGAAVVTDLSGAEVALAIPDLPSIVGLPVHFQFGVDDAGAPSGSAWTQGLEVLVGPQD